jgi:anaerobic selenocysteine-containing dehydrogenase
MATVIRGGCPHDCPDSCAWEVTVEEGRAVKLAGSASNPYTHGGLCAKVNNYLDRVYSPDRILHPLRRVGSKGEGRYEKVSWETALAEIAFRLQAVATEYGAEAVLPYDFAGNMGVVQWHSISRRFFARLGASRLLRGICGSTANAGVAATIGRTTGVLPEDIVHSRFIVLWGTNTVVTNLHLWPLIRRAKEQGATVVVVDPVRTRTAEAADWHVQPLPGTDAALALGMMHVIVAEGLHDAEYVSRHTFGFEPLRSRLEEYTPERAAALTGLEADEIVRLGRAYATTRPALIRTLVGAEKHANGGMNLRTVACLPALVGAWRERGGGLLHWTSELFDEAFDLRSLPMPQLAKKTRMINMVQIGRALTDTSLEPPIKALFVYNSNPATIAPNQNLVLEGLARDDLFTVVHDLFVTDTARYADYVLPAPSFVEQLDLLKPWGQTYVVLNRPAIEPLGESVSNTELFRRLSTAMGFTEPYLQESDEELVMRALASGHPYLEGITYERLLEEGWARLNLPEPWLPFADGGFPTRSGKSEFYSHTMEALGFDPLPAYVPTRDDGHPLVLVSAKHALHFLNSGYANLPRHAAAEKEPRLEMDPADASARGITDGELVRIHNSRGSLEARVRVGSRVRPGVVAMPFGWWRSLAPAVNALTSDGIADLGGGADFYGTRVEVVLARRTSPSEEVRARPAATKETVSPGSSPPGASGPSPSRAR